MYSQTASRLVRATPEQVYAALVDPRAVETWRVPDDMSASVRSWDAVEGGRFEVALTYRGEAVAGKTEDGTDRYAGRFERLVPGEQVVEVLEFESEDPALAGEMRLTTTLREVDAGTEVELHHEGIPDGIRAADNEAGTDTSLSKLAAYVEGAA